MSNYSASDILSKKERRRLSFAVEEMKRQLEQAKTEHTTLEGFTNDTTKYNLAQLEGWEVYRYTFKNYKDFAQDILQIINKKNQWQ